MSNYKVTEKDLIGDIKDFPIEIVEKMLEKQQEQKGYTNIKTLQTVVDGAFQWDMTSEGHTFWENVIRYKYFNIFFKKYPKKNSYVYIYQDGTKKGEDVINTLIKHGGVNNLKLNGESIYNIYYINPDDNVILSVYQGRREGSLVQHFYTEIQPESSVIEYTMQEIAYKLGINVNELRIKK